MGSVAATQPPQGLDGAEGLTRQAREGEGASVDLSRRFRYKPWFGADTLPTAVGAESPPEPPAAHGSEVTASVTGI